MNRTKEGKPQAREEQEWISLQDLEEALSKITPTPLQDNIMQCVKKDAKTGVVVKIEPEVADAYLDEVARRVFGFSIVNLSPLELNDIKRIRKELGISGDFDPTP